MRFIDFTKLGGFRLKQSVLDRMQKAYFEILYAFIGHLGIVYENNSIISGCNIDGDYITEGIMFIDGDLCNFERTLGTLVSKIRKTEILEGNNFKDGSTQVVYKTTVAVVDELIGTSLEEFVRIENFKSLTWDNIAGKPSGNMLFYAYKGSFTVNGGSGIQSKTITFPSIGTDNYLILQNGKTITGAVSYSGQFSQDSLTHNSFVALIGDLTDAPGSVIKYDYILIKL